MNAIEAFKDRTLGQEHKICLRLFCHCQESLDAHWPVCGTYTCVWCEKSCYLLGSGTPSLSGLPDHSILSLAVSSHPDKFHLILSSEARTETFILFSDFITRSTLFWVFDIRIVTMGFSQNGGLQQWAQTRQVLPPQESVSSSFLVAEFTFKFPGELIVKIKTQQKMWEKFAQDLCVLWLYFLLQHEENEGVFKLI